MKKPVVLEQVISGSLLYHNFTTSPNISNKDVLGFYSDVVEFIKESDPQINLDTENVVNLPSLFPWTFGELFKINNIMRCLQVRKDLSKGYEEGNVVRTYSLLYRKIPPEIDRVVYESMKNNIHRDKVLFRPNINICFANPVVSSERFVSMLKSLPYVSISDRYKNLSFNPEEMFQVAYGKVPGKTIASDGSVVSINEPTKNPDLN